MSYGAFPPGPYVLQVEGLEHYTGQTGNVMWRVTLRLVGTDKRFYCFWVDQPRARFAWRDVCDRWEDLPSSVGRTFVFEIVREDYQGSQDLVSRLINRVQPQPLAEVEV